MFSRVVSVLKVTSSIIKTVTGVSTDFLKTGKMCKYKISSFQRGFYTILRAHNRYYWHT